LNLSDRKPLKSHFPVERLFLEFTSHFEKHPNGHTNSNHHWYSNACPSEPNPVNLDHTHLSDFGSVQGSITHQSHVRRLLLPVVNRQTVASIVKPPDQQLFGEGNKCVVPGTPVTLKRSGVRARLRSPSTQF
jgi:hypothetical protein